MDKYALIVKLLESGNLKIHDGVYVLRAADGLDIEMGKVDLDEKEIQMYLTDHPESKDWV